MLPMNQDAIIHSQQREQIDLYLARCTVPLFWSDDQGREQIGCGALFRINGNGYFVSARHVVEAAASARELQVPDAPFTGRLRLLSLESGVFGHGRFDVSIAPIQAADVEELGEHWEILGVENLGEPRQPREWVHVIQGFPAAGIEVAADRYSATPTCLFLSPYSGDIDGDYEPGVHIVLGYDREVHVLGGGRQSAPALPGISGSPIWVGVVTAEPVWTPAKQIKVLGVQSAWMKGRYIKGVRWRVVAELFDAIDPVARQLVEDHLGSPS